MINMKEKHFFTTSSRGQASVEYVVVTSLLIIILFVGLDQSLLSSIDAYFQDMAHTLNLPLP